MQLPADALLEVGQRLQSTPTSMELVAKHAQFIVNS
jgi:hypothetical protein